MHIQTVAKKLAKFLSIISLIAFFACSAVIAHTYYETYKVKETNSQLNEIRKMSLQEEEGDWSNGMLAINPDYAGWLTVYGTQVNGPVVLGETNDTYLRTDFYGQPSTAGTMFLDASTDLSSEGNLIIYGHKMKNDTMFGSLDLFKSPQFFQENGVVRWEDKDGNHYYHIFAGLVVPGSADANGFINFPDWNNKISKDETDKMLETIQSRAFAFQGEWTTDDDTYIFLVTCDYSRTNGRLVLVGRSM